jgi:hypothetical protein
VTNTEIKVTAKKRKAIYNSLMTVLTMQPVTQPRRVYMLLWVAEGGCVCVEIYTMEPWDTSPPVATADTPLDS